jgi:hypothetical protein
MNQVYLSPREVMFLYPDLLEDNDNLYSPNASAWLFLIYPTQSHVNTPKEHKTAAQIAQVIHNFTIPFERIICLMPENEANREDCLAAAIDESISEFIARYQDPEFVTFITQNDIYNLRTIRSFRDFRHVVIAGTMDETMINRIVLQLNNANTQISLLKPDVDGVSLREPYQQGRKVDQPRDLPVDVSFKTFGLMCNRQGQVPTERGDVEELDVELMIYRDQQVQTTHSFCAEMEADPLEEIFPEYLMRMPSLKANYGVSFLVVTMNANNVADFYLPAPDGSLPFAFSFPGECLTKTASRLAHSVGLAMERDNVFSVENFCFIAKPANWSPIYRGVWPDKNNNKYAWKESLVIEVVVTKEQMPNGRPVADLKVLHPEVFLIVAG